jgi:hypothetical protein
VIVTAADEDTALAVDVVPGQACDTPLLVPMLDRTLDRVPVFDELVGDEAFDEDDLRCDCIDRDANPNFLLKPTGTPTAGPGTRTATSSANRGERRIGKAKQFRRVATR